MASSEEFDHCLFEVSGVPMAVFLRMGPPPCQEHKLASLQVEGEVCNLML